MIPVSKPLPPLREIARESQTSAPSVALVRLGANAVDALSTSEGGASSHATSSGHCVDPVALSRRQSSFSHRKEGCHSVPVARERRLRVRCPILTRVDSSARSCISCWREAPYLDARTSAERLRSDQSRSSGATSDQYIRFHLDENFPPLSFPLERCGRRNIATTIMRHTERPMS